jgi:hypothetical protein
MENSTINCEKKNWNTFINPKHECLCEEGGGNIMCDPAGYMTLKQQVEEMTDVPVNAVNIHVQGVQMKEQMKEQEEVKDGQAERA